MFQKVLFHGQYLILEVHGDTSRLTQAPCLNFVEAVSRHVIVMAIASDLEDTLRGAIVVEARALFVDVLRGVNIVVLILKLNLGLAQEATLHPRGLLAHLFSLRLGDFGDFWRVLS